MEARAAPAGAALASIPSKLPSGRGRGKTPSLLSMQAAKGGEEGAKRLHSSLCKPPKWRGRAKRLHSSLCKPPKVARKGQNAFTPLHASRQRWRGRAKRLHSSLCKPPKVARKGGKVMNRRGFPLLRPLTHRSALTRLCAPSREQRSCEVCPSRMGKPSMNP